MREMIEKAAQKIETALDWTSERHLKCSGDQAISMAAEKKEQLRGRKTVQASREDIFPPLAGAEAPDPYAACGRKIRGHEPQKGDECQKNTNSASG